MHTASSFRAFARRRAVLLAAALFFASSAALADLRIGVAVGPFAPYAYPLSALQDRAQAVPEGATLQFEDSAGDPIRPLGRVGSLIAPPVDARRAGGRRRPRAAGNARQLRTIATQVTGRPAIRRYRP
ncbi:hypothetical protein SAMN04244572_00082 [Azotobacter beijerinckii]|uniref:Uncharacterized protein n=1 Tax=Azotobacter beijerinckii TaxID=170623 RepID=A0A1H6QN42_9GAMM|nr:hypothetical protein [Azotobacter beijerinckii]SEI40685.1 hypothetical protein SAMN04244572_00082 [Azotobacter beijerinckii]